MKRFLQKILFIFRARLLRSKVHVRAEVKNPRNIRVGARVKILANAAVDGLSYGDGVILGDGVTLNPYVRISGRVHIGQGSEINNFTFLAGSSEAILIGANVLVGPHVTMVSANHGFADPTIPIKYQPGLARQIVIEDDVWIGAGAVILPGVRIRRGSIVGAGAVVTKSFPQGSILTGVPAQVSGFRPGFSNECIPATCTGEQGTENRGEA